MSNIQDEDWDEEGPSPEALAALRASIEANTLYVIKIGTTSVDLSERMRQIGHDHYGAATQTKNGFVVADGFSAWISHAIATSQPPIDPTVRLLPRAIEVNLPPGLSRRVFDTSVHVALKSRSLERVPEREMPRRFTGYDIGKIRLSAARELYVLSPHDRADGDLLLGAIEGVLRRFRGKRT